MTTSERFGRMVARFFKGIALEILDPQTLPAPQQVTYPPFLSASTVASQEYPKAPDIEKPTEEIDLFKRMKDAVAEGDIDMADVAQVEAVLRQQREAREAPRVEDSVKRVQAPDA